MDLKYLTSPWIACSYSFLVFFMLAISTAQGFIGYGWQPSVASQEPSCNVAPQQRQACGSWYTSRSQCWALGCCYQAQLFLYQSCFMPYSPKSNINARLGPSPVANQPSNQPWRGNLFLHSFWSSLSTPKPTTTTTVPTTTTRRYFTTTASQELRSELLLFLAQLTSQSANSRGKAPATITPRTETTRSVSTATPKTVQASASGVVREEGPFSRAIDFNRTSNGAQNGGDDVTKTCDFLRSGRRACGSLSISFDECLVLGCCWDTSSSDITWCFHPTSDVDLASSTNENNPVSREELLLTTETDESEDNPAQRNTDDNNSGENLVESPLPMDLSSNTFPIQARSTVVPEHELSGTVSEPSSISALQLGVTSTTFHSYSSPTMTTNDGVPSSVVSTSNPTTEPLWIKLLLEKHELTRAPSTSTSATTTRATAITTTTPATASTEVLPPYIDPVTTRNQHNRGNYNTGNHQPINSQVDSTDDDAETLQNIVSFLKLIDDMNRRRRLQQSPQTCNLRDRDSCCSINPTAPCCEFQTRRDIASRVAPMTRVVGGGPAGKLRHSVAYLSRGMYREHNCGGTLIDNQWVLTAAHCVLEFCNGASPGSNLLVSLGKNRKSPLMRDPGQQDIYVSRVICHQNHCKPEGHPRLNDLALLRLQRPAYTSPYVTPASMPVAYETPQENRNCLMLGWGQTQGSGYPDVLKEVSVPLVPNEKCNRPDWRNCVVRACMMCAGAEGAEPCAGDSGGPLFCQRPNGLYVLHGVYSWGRCGAVSKKPAVYTRASYFIDWINGITANYP